MLIKKIKKALKEPSEIPLYFLLKTARVWSDKAFLKMLFFVKMGYKLNLNNPQTFNEKLQWLKIYNRKPEMVDMVCKVEAKKYVANIIGEDYIIPTLGVYNSVEEIDFDKLPNQFVLKCTHDSGGIVICSDKSKLDIEAAKDKLAKGLKINYYYQNREWPYKLVKPRIIAEEFMVDESGFELKDYKFFCFNGKVEFLFIASDRGSKTEETKFDFFDTDFNHLPFLNGHPNSKKKIQKPENFDKMIELASKLSVGYPHLRVDFYNVKGNIYFGELTFYHFSGMVPFEPREWDDKLGKLIKLSKL